MAYKPKGAKEKMLADHGLPKVVNVPPKMQAKFGKGKMVVPAPMTVDAVIRKVKRGRLITPKLIRQTLAKDFKADTCCPLTTGIFIRLCAEAAVEDLEAGKKNITPYWRVVTDEGGLIDKFPGGASEQAKLLQTEGHEIVSIRGKKRVRDFGNFLAAL
jgi:hypothetical protein